MSEIFAKRIRPSSFNRLFIMLILLLSMNSDAVANDLILQPSFVANKPVSPNDKLILKFNRLPQPAEGRLALLIGDLDVTHLTTIETERLGYHPVLPLAAGETQVSVWLVSPNYEWKEIGRFPLLVASPAAATALTMAAEANVPVNDPASAQPTPQRRTWGFDKIETIKSLSLNLKSQPASAIVPAPLPGAARAQFTDFAGQTALGASFARGGWTWSNRFEMTGSTFQNEAIRFAELGGKAPRIDLSNYLLQVQHGTSVFALGHVSFGTHRHLINGFSSRGLSVKQSLGRRADFTAGAVNGTSIVGWSNFLGLNRRKHQMLSGVVGYEFLPARPQGLRLEAGFLSGSQLPLNNFNQRTLTDAERSLGGSLRLLASDAKNRVKLDAGFTRSRFSNPFDPLLAASLSEDQPGAIVPVRETTRSARYADLSLALLQNVKLDSQSSANLSLNARHERVDPLFRSVAAFTQADRQQNQLELTGNLGEANFTLSHLRFNDNLAEIPSVLTSLTRRDAFNINLPLSFLIKSFRKPRAVAGETTTPAPVNLSWLPRLGFNLDRTHQFGVSIPINGAFRPDLVPDQLSLNSSLSLEWQFAKWRLGYRFNRSMQNNRQPGRELADFENRTSGLTLGFNPAPQFDLNFEVGEEQARNLEFSRTDRTLRYAMNTNWRLTPRASFLLNLSTTGAGDLARTADNRSIEGDAQWSYRLDAEHPIWRRFFPGKVQAQFFIRYANRFARTRDRIFLVNTLNKVWTVNTGLTLSF